MLGAVLLAYASCFFAPERPGGQGGGTDASSDDAVRVDMSSGDGTMTGSGTCPSDDMGSNPDPCGAWGFQDVSNGGAVARNSGVLLAKVNAFGDRAQCATPTNINFAQGISIDLQQPLQGGSGDSTQFTVGFAQNGYVTIETKQLNSLQISASCSGPHGFSSPMTYSAAYRYLRIAPLSGTTVAAYYSDSGTSWSSMGSCSLTGNDISLASVRFGATAGSGGVSSRAAVFDDLKSCIAP